MIRAIGKVFVMNVTSQNDGACQGCSETCKTCHWAFPNSNEMPLTIRLPKEQFDFVDEQIKKNKNWLVDLINNNQ